MENMEKIPINAVPSKESIPSIFILVVIEAIMFLSTSMLDIIILIINIENHSGRYKFPRELPTMKSNIPENSVSYAAKQYKLLRPGILNSKSLKEDYFFASDSTSSSYLPMASLL